MKLLIYEDDALNNLRVLMCEHRVEYWYYNHAYVCDLVACQPRMSPAGIYN